MNRCQTLHFRILVAFLRWPRLLGTTLATIAGVLLLGQPLVAQTISVGISNVTVSNLTSGSVIIQAMITNAPSNATVRRIYRRDGTTITNRDSMTRAGSQVSADLIGLLPNSLYECVVEVWVENRKVAQASSKFVTKPATTQQLSPFNFLDTHKYYQNYYNQQIETETLSGDSAKYYSTSYYIHGLLSAAEASGDEALLLRSLHYISNMINQAKPLVRDGITFLQWGPIGGTNRPVQLDTFQAAGAVIRAAVVIQQHPIWKTKYANESQKIVQFIDNSIIQYWFNKTTGIYKDPSSKWQAGQIPWLSKDLGGWGSFPRWEDKCSHLGIISSLLYSATKKPLYLEIASRIAKGFRFHLKSNGSGWIWSAGMVPISETENKEGTPDTSHSNREPMMMVFMHEAGIEFTRQDVDRMAHTLIDVIWNQDLNNPMFKNYIDGADKPYRQSLAPGSVGNIYTGWALVGRYSQEAQTVLASTFKAIAIDKKRNASLDANNSSYGLIELSGTLMRNISNSK